MVCMTVCCFFFLAVYQLTDRRCFSDTLDVSLSPLFYAHYARYFLISFGIYWCQVIFDAIL